MPSISITLSSSETGIQTNIQKDGVKVSAEIISKMYELTKAMSHALANATDKAEPKPGSSPGCRIVNKCFQNGQRIRHICKGSIWEGTFTHKVNELGDIGVIVGDNGYWYTAPDCISQFARDHYYNLDKKYDVMKATERAWEESECLIDGKWVSTYSLSPLN
jgi:hypothetical protein